MSTLAKLSKQAVQHEHDRQYEKALALFARLFDEAAAAGEDVDVALFNRAGDVAMRLGDSAAAVRYYERAVDAYAAGGLLNNAIAVCNKMLRHAPDHAPTHYTLGVLHAKQGFRGDARQHLAEYADRMHRAGRDDEAGRALTEFAALCPVGDDPRTVLGQHLSKGGRQADAAARLQTLLDATVPGIAAGSVGATPTPIVSAVAVLPAPAAERAGHLVFLDVSGEDLDVADEIDVAPLAGLETTVLDDVIEVEEVELATDWAEPASSAEPAVTDAAFDFEVEPLDLEMPELEAAALELSVFEMPEPEAFAPELESFVFETATDDSAVRWADALPDELPMLSLAGWIGSASALSVFDAPAASVVVPALHHHEPALVAHSPLPVATRDDGYVDLGAWLRDDEPASTTRMTTADAPPTGDETADFDRMLGAFRAGVARNVDANDADSHFDLGVAFREMGLIDDAIAAFQKAARAPRTRLRASEAMGQCFLDRGSPSLAVTVLQRALSEHDAATSALGSDSPHVGVLYLLGVAHAQLGDTAPARVCLERVVAADIQFRDAALRLSQLPASSP